MWLLRATPRPWCPRPDVLTPVRGRGLPTQRQSKGEKPVRVPLTVQGAPSPLRPRPGHSGHPHVKCSECAAWTGGWLLPGGWPHLHPLLHFTGWWFDACGPSNLNGMYYPQRQSTNRFNGIKWYYWKGSGYSLKATAMMIRPADF